MPRQPALIFKAILIAFVALIIGLIVALPGRTYLYTPDSRPDLDGFEGFSGVETDPNLGYRFSWALADARLELPNLPRYAPLNLRLRLNLQRPADVPPTHLEIYAGSFEPASAPQLLTTFDFDPNSPEAFKPKDFHVTIPPQGETRGAIIELKSNTFKVQGDNRQLGFTFLEAELSLPRSHLLRLVWPYPYWPAVFLLLSALAAWGLLAGLRLVEAWLLVAMAAFTSAVLLPATYQASGWLILVGLALWATYGWQSYRLARGGAWSFWPLFGAANLLVIFYLFSNAEFRTDIDQYFRWGKAIHDNGIWNIYNQGTGLDYLPLTVYLLWFYNLIVYALNLQNNYLVWKIFVSLTFIAAIALIYAFTKLTAHDQTTAKPAGVVLLAFNVAIFFNATIWGQTDIVVLVLLLGAFYLIHRQQALGAGLLLGLVLISKPQGWFVLPVLVWLLVRWCGWRRSFTGLMLGGLVALSLAAVAFGFDISAVQRYFNSPEFAGEYLNDNPTAFNVNYLILGEEKTTLPIWLSFIGFTIVSIILLFVLYLIIKNRASLKLNSLAITVVVVTCFTWLIKMKERYLLYSLPFLGLAALQDRRLFKPLLALSWLQLVQLILGLFRQSRWKKYSLSDYFYFWSAFLNQDWFQRFLSVCSIVLFGYLLSQYLKAVRTVAPTPEISTSEVITH